MKTTPAPENKIFRKPCDECVRAWPAEKRAAHAQQTLAEHYAQLRAADARSARRFEGL